MTTSGSVLLVDDNEATRYILGTWLRRAGYEVAEATTGAGALVAVEAAGFDLVVLDVNLPDAHGLEICEAIKQRPSTSAVPVLHVSATAIDVEHRAAGLRRGADAYLVEPIEPEELLATATALIRYGRARRRAELLAERLSLLHTASLEINAAGDAARLAVAAVSAAASLCTGPAAVAVRTEGGGVLAVGGAGPASAVPLLADELAALAEDPGPTMDRLAPGLLDGSHLRSLPVAGRLDSKGAAVLLTADWEPADPELGTVLEQLIRGAALAAENLRLFVREHAIAAALQQSLLPALPAVPWLEVAVRYAASAAQTEVGGDFYDLVVLEADRVALVIGDVQGHSVRAATIMAMLRNSLGAYLLEGRPPGRALEMLDRLLQRFHPDVIATVCCIVLHRDGHAVIANAGHLPPMVAAGGGARAAGPSGVLLGLDEHPVEETALDLEAGSTLVLFTDGLVERRGELITHGLERAAKLIAAEPADPERLCDRLIANLAPPGAASDDIAVLAVRISPTAAR